MSPESSQPKTIGVRLDHPEGVAWDPSTETLVAGGEAGQIYRLDPDGTGQDLIGTTGGSILGVAVDADGRVYACDTIHRSVLRIDPDGHVATYSQGPQETPFILPNFLVFDGEGALYVSDSGTWGADDGRVVRVGPDGRALVWSTAAPAFTNGLALSRDGKWLYVAESSTPRVSRIEITPDGRSGRVELLVELLGTVPDGLALAADGSLFITCFRPDRIYRLIPEGKLEVVVDDWQAVTFAAPTNIAFFGPALQRAAVACLGGEWLVVFDPECRGSPLHYPGLTRR